MISKKRLRQAAEEAGRLLDRALPAPEECQHTFSPDFLNRMEALLREQKHTSGHRALRRVAGFTLACLLSGALLLSTNAKAAEVFFGWIGEQVQGMQGYVFEGGGTEEPVQVTYVLPEIPDGYSLWDVSEEDLNYVIDYANEEGLILEFGYSKPPTQNADTSNYFQTDGMEEKNCQINGVMADFFWDPSGEKGNALIWEDPENHVLLYLSGYLNEEEIVMLAESVQKAS